MMALVAYAALLAFMINIAAEGSRTAQLIAPFLIMAISVAAWFLSVSLHSREGCRHYRQCLTVIKAAALISLYLAGNYFVVSELGSYMPGASGQAGEEREWQERQGGQGGGGVSMGWLFWILTSGYFPFCIYTGASGKKIPFSYGWSLALIAATVFTIRRYYHVLHP